MEMLGGIETLLLTEMKRLFSILGLGLAALASQAQVKITSLARNGLLQWTNPIQGSATYRVEWASANTNTWQTLALVMFCGSHHPTAAMNLSDNPRTAGVGRVADGSGANPVGAAGDGARTTRAHLGQDCSEFDVEAKWSIVTWCKLLSA